jgi:hypothetical protein
MHTFSSILSYLHTFESACPKQVPSDSSNTPKLLYDTIEVKALAHVYKLDVSSLTKQEFFGLRKTYLIAFAI